MLKYLNSYLQPITVACMLFPAIAAVFTLPFVIRHYRKFGGIAIMRTVIVYSFILYCMCTFLLTVLPLPSREAVERLSPSSGHSVGEIVGIAAAVAGIPLRCHFAVVRYGVTSMVVLSVVLSSLGLRQTVLAGP